MKKIKFLNLFKQKNYTTFKRKFKISKKLVLATSLVFTVSFFFSNKFNIFQKTSYEASEKVIIPGEYIKGLKDYTSKQVSEHKTLEKGIWVIYKNGVYDITNFIIDHPGLFFLILRRR